MPNIKVVIGANFGDEGKGLMTDYFCNKNKNSLGVRFSGGSQAGHTVVTPDGIRHVFHHFSSGTLSGADTYLSKYFILNPMMFRKEYDGLIKKGLDFKVFIDEKCLVTTPYDMLVNQIVEDYRKDNRHGSCGLGINETIKRNSKISIRFIDLIDRNRLLDKLLFIRECIPERLKELGVDNISSEYMKLIINGNIITNYLNDISFMLKHSEIVNSTILHKYDNIVFEGSQGLLLDQNNSDYFPYLTPSNVGMQNVVETLKELKYDNKEIEISYLTRCYMTRHGPGKFLTETTNKPFEKIVDMTNIPNPFQGTLRYGLLDLDLLKKTIQRDLCFAKDYNYVKSIAITCLDQSEKNIDYVYGGSKVTSDLSTFINNIGECNNMGKAYLSYGMTRKTI